MTQSPDSFLVTLKTPHTLGDDLSQIEYHPNDYLASGVLGDVYHPSTHPEWVIKVPRTDADRLFQFGQEARLLTYLSNKTLHTPPIATNLEQTVIVMPFYRKADRYQEKLTYLLQQGKYLDAEEMTLTVMIAFCDAMIALHTYEDIGNSHQKYTCTDRKVIDFYYFDAKPPVILDWNVLSAHTTDFLNSEIQVFGGLIHEAYFGSKGKMPYAPFYDRRWELKRDDGGALSVGLRFLLARMVQHPTYYQTSDKSDYFIGLKTHLEAWHTALRGGWVRNDVIKHLAIDKTELATAIYQDLEWRLRGTDEKARQNALKIADELDATPSENIRKSIINALSFNVDDAQKVLIDAQNNPNNLSGLLKTHLGRWQFLLAYAQNSDKILDSRTKAEIRGLVAMVGERLHTDEPLLPQEIHDLRQSYERLRQLYTDEYLISIGYELELHEKSFAFNQVANFDKRADLLLDIRRTFDPSHTYLDEPFFYHLFDTYLLQKLTTADTHDALRQEHALIIKTDAVKGWGKWIDGWLNSLKQTLETIEQYKLTPITEDITQLPTRLTSIAECLSRLNEGWHKLLATDLRQSAQVDVTRFVEHVKQNIAPNAVVWQMLSQLRPTVLQMNHLLTTTTYPEAMRRELNILLAGSGLDGIIASFMTRYETNLAYFKLIEDFTHVTSKLQDLKKSNPTHPEIPKLGALSKELATDVWKHEEKYANLLDKKPYQFLLPSTRK